MSRDRKRIVIIGGSFAGLAAASRISRRYSVTVVDQREQFEWTPNIHEILSGVKAPGEVLISRREVLARMGHEFVCDAVSRLDVDGSAVHTESGGVLPFDACLVAAGGVRDTFGVKGVDRHAIDFRLAQDAQRVETRLGELMGSGRQASVVIIGGGVSGVEALGEILRNHRGEDRLKLHVVEKERQILPGLPAALGLDVRRQAESSGVRFHTGTQVRSVDGRGVVLESGKTIPARLVVWAAGMAAPRFLADSGLIAAGQRWAAVRQTLQSRLADNVFIAGDNAELPSPLTKQAYHAIEMGEYAGDNMQRLLCDRTLRRFRPSRKPMLIAFGDLDTYLVAGETVVASKFLAAAKESVYQLYMARLSMKLPPFSFTRDVGTRFVSAMKNLVLPELTSCGALSAIRGSRIVQLRARG